MKNSWLVLVVIIFCVLLPTFFLSGQETPVPKAVMESHKKMYPTAEELIWEQEENTYLAVFDEGGFTRKATYNRKGIWQQTITSLELEELPLSIQKFLNHNYGLEEYNRIRKIEIPTVVKYFVKLEIENNTIILTFDEDGKLLEKEIESL